MSKPQFVESVQKLILVIDKKMQELDFLAVPFPFRRFYFYLHARHCEVCTLDCWVKMFSPPYQCYFSYWARAGFPVRWDGSEITNLDDLETALQKQSPQTRNANPTATPIPTRGIVNDNGTRGASAGDNSVVPEESGKEKAK